MRNRSSIQCSFCLLALKYHHVLSVGSQGYHPESHLNVKFSSLTLFPDRLLKGKKKKKSQFFIFIRMVVRWGIFCGFSFVCFCLSFFCWWTVLLVLSFCLFVFVLFCSECSEGPLDLSRLFYGKPSYVVLQEFCLVFKYCRLILYPATKLLGG